MRREITIYILLLALAAISCKKEDLAPSYIEITKEDLQNSMDMNDFNFVQNTTYTAEELAAIARQNFTHVGLLVNGKNLGVYTLPAKIPILNSDSTQLYIMPCVKMDGISTTVRNYDVMVGPCITTIFLKKGEIYSFKDNPIRFKFQKGVQIPLLELFSNSTVFSPDTIVSSIPLKIEMIDGQNVGVITINETQKPFELIGPEMIVPAQGKNLFFEMDYKCDRDIYVGIDLYYNGLWNARSLIGLRPTSTWNKVYVNLTKIVGNGAQGSATIKARMRLAGNSMDAEQAKFCFDNMKVIYIK
ncbi:MAG: hypothetical protein LBL18_04800 [Bacteroidales bacterium]|jgi:hypothetical protein|nr:hypothetical protein [Bacteroidales bacterium]